MTRNVARTAARAAARRTRHERAAARPEAMPMNDPLAAAEMLAVLDDVLAGLPARERDAISLRFFEARPLADVGRAMGVSEEAARKRVARGLERIRSRLIRRGVAVPSAGLAAAMVALAAPPAPATTVTATLAAGTAVGATTAGSAVALSKGVLFMLTLKQVAAVAAVAVIGLSLATGVAMLTQAPSPPPPAPPATTPIAGPVTKPTPASAPAPVIGEVYIGGLVERPGAYSINGRPVTLKTALAWARPDASAGRLRAYVLRKEDARPPAERVAFLADLDRPDALVAALQPDDHVVVRLIEPAKDADARTASMANLRQIGLALKMLDTIGMPLPVELPELLRADPAQIGGPLSPNCFRSARLTPGLPPAAIKGTIAEQIDQLRRLGDYAYERPNGPITDDRVLAYERLDSGLADVAVLLGDGRVKTLSAAKVADLVAKQKR